MPGKKRTQDERSDAQKESNRAQIAELYLKKHWTQAKIAEFLNISQPTVSRDIAVLKARWKKQANTDVKTAQGEELERLAALEAELWEAWAESKQDAETFTEKVKGISAVEDDQPIATAKETTTQRKGQTGDVRYLTEIISCINTRMKILGLEAAVRLKLGDEDEDKGFKISIERVPARALPDGNGA